MNRFTMSNLALRMSYKGSPAEIEKIVGRLDIEPADHMDIVEPDKVNVATIQTVIKRYSSLSDYVIDMNVYLSEAVNQRAHLVCLPAYAGLLPATMVPQFENLLQKVQPRRETGYPDINALYETLNYFSDFVYEAYFNTMSILAARHNIYLMAGSSLYFSEDDLVHRSFLFNNKGDLVGYQDKLSPNTMEREMGVEPASELRIFETPLGNLAILIEGDADYFEIARIAKGLGAQILLSPTAFPGEYTTITSALGLNMRIQEQQLYGVQSTLVGDTGLGIALEGGCAVFAPGDLARGQNGVLAKANGRFEPDVVTASLDLDRLNTMMNPYLDDVNPDLMAQYVEKLY